MLKTISNHILTTSSEGSSGGGSSGNEAEDISSGSGSSGNNFISTTSSSDEDEDLDDKDKIDSISNDKKKSHNSNHYLIHLQNKIKQQIDKQKKQKSINLKSSKQQQQQRSGSLNSKKKVNLTLQDHYNHPITCDSLPNNLYGLTFGRMFNHTIQPNTLPGNLKSLVFGYSFNKPLQAGSLPVSLKSLVFGASFNQPIFQNVLPPSLVSLTMGITFNKPFSPDAFPASLRTLVFSDKFRFPLILPPNLESLTLGRWYTEEIQLCPSLKHIKIGDESFNDLAVNEYCVMTKDFAYDVTVIDDQLDFIDITNDTYEKCLSIVVTKEGSTSDNHLFTINLNSSHSIQCMPEVGCCWVSVFLENKESKKYLEIFSSVKVPKGSSFRFSHKYQIIDKSKSDHYQQTPYDITHLYATVELNNQLFYKMKRFDNGSNKVYLIMSHDTKELLISKEVWYSKFCQKRYDRIFQEIEAMITLRGSPNIVQYITYSHDRENQVVYILMEYCEGGDLHQRLSEKHKWNDQFHVLHSNHNLNLSMLEISCQYFKEEEIWNYCTELLEILTVLDKHSIIHCDIKPGNLFFKNNQLMLGDFGCCKILSLDDSDDSIDSSSSNDSLNVGTFGYLAQELELQLEIDGRADLYSVGSTILRLLSCHPEDSKNHSLIESQRDNVVISTTRYSLDLIEFVRSLLVAKREDRATLQKILRHAQIGEKRKSWTYYFDIPIKYPITHSITKLTFTHNFNQPIPPGTLPNTLRVLEFLRSYNQPIESNVLPESLEKLKLCGFFDKYIPKGALPSNLKVLQFGDEFSNKIEKRALPNSLEVLIFGKSFNHKLGRLPSSLKKLTLSFHYRIPLKKSIIPKTLKQITCRLSIVNQKIINRNNIVHFIIWRNKKY
ncbi:FNIP repeat-containing protein [Heterostelium album PN500]|uniref:FNIP repeat-containing protein n=1 Tax=Heterostelium pallidum (strain ATCC 26659 / Pp 5 / PN500) TaxID=670386 RepID=D3BB56_HETP5|nr:FNIP repeat-containing protein [Heterostelium album PN500]EFA81793.1 FNIP repeat-containing protein [Heterostelium album PN500]|eukprot:XP_020433910.1 FNIP repeat-containing protein [Heterostelium album PN500]